MRSWAAEKLLVLWMWLQGLRPAKPGADDFAREQWRTSTRRMGVRFTERVRDHFRRAWFRLVG